MTSCSTSRWHFLNQRQLSRITHGKHVPFVAPSSCQIASAPPQIVALMGEILCLDLQWKHGTLHTRTSFPLVHFHLSFSLFPCILLITILVPLQFHFYHYRKIKFWVLYNTFMTYRIQTSLILFLHSYLKEKWGLSFRILQIILYKLHPLHSSSWVTIKTSWYCPLLQSMNQLKL